MIVSTNVNDIQYVNDMRNFKIKQQQPATLSDLPALLAHCWANYSSPAGRESYSRFRAVQRCPVERQLEILWCVARTHRTPWQLELWNLSRVDILLTRWESLASRIVKELCSNSVDPCKWEKMLQFAAITAINYAPKSLTNRQSHVHHSYIHQSNTWAHWMAPHRTRWETSSAASVRSSNLSRWTHSWCSIQSHRMLAAPESRRERSKAKTIIA